MSDVIKSSRFSSFQPLREAQIDEASRTMRVVVMTEGLGNLRDKNFYDKSAVESACRVFRGKQFFIDHPSASEEEDRPERSVRDLAGYFAETELGHVKDPETGENLTACFATLKYADSEPGRLAFEQAKEALDYQRRFPNSKDVYTGISINGGGVSHPATVKGMEVNMVTEIQEAFSADIVTKPARGGRFVALVREAWKTGRSAGRPPAGNREKRKRREAMATVVKDPKLKKHVKEAAQAFKALSTAVEAKEAEKIPAPIKALVEAVGRLAKSQHDGLKKLAESVSGRLAKFTKVMEQGGLGGDEKDLDPATLVSDIKDDVDRLSAVMGEEGEDMMAGEGEEETEGEDEGEGEAEGEEETEGEDEGEGEGDEHDLGMADDDDEEDKERAMKYSCASCGETNRIMPPKGFKLARMGESAKGTDGQEALVRRLRRALESKERRFSHQNREKRELLRENIQLRAEVMASKRLTEAKKVLREARIPPDIMKAKELLPFEPEQWPTMINSAKRSMAKESALLNRGGAGPRGGGSGGGQDNGGKDAKATFKESYQKPRDVVGV